MNPGPAKIARIYLSNTDKFRHMPLYEAIVFAAKRYGLSGATVLTGVMGYGSTNQIYSKRFWEISEKIPVIVELVDEPESLPLEWYEPIEWANEGDDGSETCARYSEYFFGRDEYGICVFAKDRLSIHLLADIFIPESEPLHAYM